MAAGEVVEWKERGYGFITPDAGGRDVFFHTTDVDGDITRVRIGLRVTYELDTSSDGGKRPKATNVQFAPREAPQPDGDLECVVVPEPEFRKRVTGAINARVPEIVNEVTEFARENGWLE